MRTYLEVQKDGVIALRAHERAACFKIHSRRRRRHAPASSAGSVSVTLWS